MSIHSLMKNYSAYTSAAELSAVGRDIELTRDDTTTSITVLTAPVNVPAISALVEK